MAQISLLLNHITILISIDIARFKPSAEIAFWIIQPNYFDRAHDQTIIDSIRSDLYLMVNEFIPIYRQSKIRGDLYSSAIIQKQIALVTPKSQGSRRRQTNAKFLHFDPGPPRNNIVTKFMDQNHATKGKDKYQPG